MNAFFELHRDLPREGPGTPDDVRRVVEGQALGGGISVLDAGCGPGADTRTLAELLPDARIEALDLYGHFVAEARAATRAFGDRVRIKQGDMANITGPRDLIWCAGAIYFLGVTQALSAWRPALAEGGLIAFSEPVLPEGEISADLEAFWEEYPAITAFDGLAQRIDAARFEVRDHWIVPQEGWAAYYGPLEARVAALRSSAPSDALRAVLDEAEREIGLWKRAGADIRYEMCVVAPR